jgi:hypothetical protein
MKAPETNRFEQAAQKQTGSLVGDFWNFLRYCKKWWLLPIVGLLFLLALLVLLSGSAAAPFIYTLF